MSEAIAEDGSRLTLYPYSDNFTALQAFCDAHTQVLLPEGNWPISQTLNIIPGFTVLRGRGMEATILRRTGTHNGPVVGLGGQGAWTGSAGYLAADGFTIAGMHLIQTADGHTANKCIFNNDGDDMVIENVRVSGSAYEGIVTGSNCRNVRLSDIEALNCGNGGPAYALSTAGINATSVNLVIEDFVCVGCGQGVESGNTNVVIRRGVVQNPGAGEPKIGIHVGSSVYGLYLTYIDDCIIYGIENAIGGGPNGVGRLAGVFIRRNKIYDGTIGFAGGVTTNTVPHADQGPDTYGSEICDNEIIIASADQVAIQYSPGPAEANEVYGREPLTIQRNVVTRGTASAQTSADVLFAGKITARCIVQFNRFLGRDVAPSQGDIASISNGLNPAVAGFPTLAYGSNIALNSGSFQRSLIAQIEGG